MSSASWIVAALLLILTTVQGNEDRPNILFLMADQMRADALGCSGNKLAQTPNLDRLAADGVRYTNAYSSTPICTPARAAILTGLSPWYHGMLGYGNVATKYEFEMPRALSDAGYYTCSIGKDHFGWNSTTNSGIEHGYHETDLYDGLPQELDDYDEWFAKTYPEVNPMATGLQYNDYRAAVYGLPESLHPTAWVGRGATSFIETYNNSQPFFLKASFHRPHSPYDPPKRWMEQFKPDDMPPPFISNAWDKEYALHYDTPPPSMWAGNISTESVRLSRQAYYASTGFVDEWIGEILQTLDRKGLRNNTFIFFTSDHGDMMGDHFLWRKGYPYFGSARVPMLLSWPPSMDSSVSVQRGTSLDVVTEMRDILPTFLDVAGINIPDTVNGSSLLQTLKKSPTLKWREYIDLEMSITYSLIIHWNALTDGKMKYVFRAFYPDEQLFDMTQDDKELVNVAGQSKYNSALLEWRARMVSQFENEGRGDGWVKDGVLQRRVGNTLYSPHYPGNKQMLPQDYPCN
ncbi:arylsulfatase-like [Halichondria panicea]|uniref:arylsulfatase-like n=1 Tax=Halichondria panicea TaxID=6063 RepID=UPI00312B4A38